MPQCNECSQIDWGALRCPTFRQLRDLKRDDDHVHFDSDVVNHPHVPLGTLRRIRDSTSQCQVCELIWQIIVRDNGSEEPSFTDQSAGDRDIECFARVQWFGQFIGPGEPPLPATDSTDHRTGRDARRNLVRRLSLRIGVPASDCEDEVECHWYYISFCIQVCPTKITPVAPAIATEAPAEVPALVFSGRIRPLTMNLDWVRNWMTICANEHAAECGDWRTFQPGETLQSESCVLRTDLLNSPAIRLINVSRNCIEALARPRTTTQPIYQRMLR